jgi:hypothetical protein
MEQVVLRELGLFARVFRQHDFSGKGQEKN